MIKILNRDNRSFRLGIAILSLIFISGVAITDFVTGYKTAVSLLYMVTIALAVFFSWGYVAILIAFLSGVSDTIFDYAWHHTFRDINTLNSVTQATFFLTFAFVLLALKKSQARLKLLSRTDPITELVNSRYFFEIGNAEIQRSLRYKHPFTVVYIDVDNFKTVNDTFGHSAGDALLREIVKRVKSTIRNTDTMARLGGDEFAILLPETSGAGIKVAVGRIQNSLLGMKMSNGMPVTFSIGVITNNCRPCSFDGIIKAADSLMYEAKRSGKNTVKSGIFGE